MSTKLIIPLILVGGLIAVTPGCATTSAMTSIAKSRIKKQATKAAVNVAAEKAVNAATHKNTQTTADGVATTGGTVKQSATKVIAPTARKEKSGMLKIRSKNAEFKKTYGSTKHLRGVTEYIVPFYRINYLTDSNYVNQANNSYTAAMAKVLSKLEGVSTGTFDEITEIAYADFKDKMNAAGFTIKPHADLPTVQKYMAKSKYPTMGKHAYKSVAKGTASTSGLNSRRAPNIASNEKVSVLDINLDANFVINNRNEKKFNILQAKETVYTSQGANVLGGLIVFVPRHVVAFEIGQPPYSQIAFGTMTDVTKGGDKAGDAAVAVTSLLFGGHQKKRMTTRRKLVTADEAKYKEAMVDALKKTNTLIVNNLAGYRDKS